MTHQQKITLADMGASGIYGLLIYCADYRCSHLIRLSADRWPDDVRLSDLEPRFVCTACGRRGAECAAEFSACTDRVEFVEAKRKRLRYSLAMKRCCKGARMRDVRSTAIAVIMTPLAICSSSNAEPLVRHATFFCASEIEAGLSFDEVSKQWRGTTFKPRQRFVLKVDLKKTESFGDQPEGLEVYYVSVIPEGKNGPGTCYAQNYGLADSNPIEIKAYAKLGALFCQTLSRTYRLDLKTNRFLSAYIEGYYGGDTNNDTPSFAAGKCTKIN